MFHHLSRFISYLLCDIVYRIYNVNIVNEEGLTDAQRKYEHIIITGNHNHIFDALFITRVLRNYSDIHRGHLVGYWVKDELLKRPFIGAILRQTKTIIPIGNKPGSLTTEVIDRTKQILLQHNYVIIFMQRSTRHHDLRSPKTGVVRTALATKTAILPVGISCTGKNNFAGYLLRKRHVSVCFGRARMIPPIKEKIFSQRKRKIRYITNELWKDIEKLHNNLNIKVVLS
jgi:1-acyl-sn-glycerol-3-phosphate acyltransferase